MKENTMLGRQEAATFLGLTEAMLYSLIRRGAIKATRVGRVWKVSCEALEAWKRKASALVGEMPAITAPVVDLDEVNSSSLDVRLTAALLSEQRQTNRLLTLLINRGEP